MPDHVSLWGLLIPIRRGFDQYVNLRPCKLMPGATTPLANRGPKDIDFYVVRENTEGEYSSVGGRMFPGTDREFVTQQSILTRIGTDRIMKYAFELAMTRPRRKVTSATKSNGITFTMPYWDERFAEMAKNYPGVTTDQFHIDILCAHFVQHPDWFDVVVGSNLFGDILSDLGPAVAGSIGIAASANINPEKAFPSMFEPVHGSAPGHRGQVDRQPDRPDLVRRHDAGASGGEGGGECHRAHRSRRCCARAGRAPATWAARPARWMWARPWPKRSAGPEARAAGPGNGVPPPPPYLVKPFRRAGAPGPGHSARAPLKDAALRR